MYAIRLGAVLNYSSAHESASVTVMISFFHS